MVISIPGANSSPFLRGVFCSRLTNLLGARTANSCPRAMQPLHARSDTASTVRLDADDKLVYLIRHGITEMNCWLRDFRVKHGPDAEVDASLDPLLYDTRLTAEGVAGAKRLREKVARLSPRPEVVVCSPLTRALHTASIAFAGLPDVPRVVEPLAAEKVWHSSDVGTVATELRDAWGREFAFPDDMRDVWWYTDGTGDPRVVVDEPPSHFLPRMERLREALLARPEKCVALVCHWGVINALTGMDFENCEVRGFSGDELQVRKLPDWELVAD